MPSRFAFRDKIGLSPKKGSARAASPGTSSSAAPSQPLPDVPTLSAPDNSAFTLAIQRHLQKLDQAELDAFRSAHRSISPESILSQVKAFDNEHHQASASRRCLEPLSVFLRVLEQFMQGVAIGIQCNPEISSVIVGGVRIVIDVLADVYGDLMDFSKQARLVFVNREGAKRSWNSMRIFIRVQWEPFEARFGTINSSFKLHLKVLLHSAQSLQLNTILQGSLDADKERQRAQQKEEEGDRKNFMHWISKLNFDEDHDTIYSKKHPGTGDWLLRREQFRRWFHRPESSLMWCVGRPGVGKSVLAANTLEYITTVHGLDENVGIAFVYFRYDSPELQRPSSVISAFIKQLCWKKSTIPTHLLDFCHTYDRDARVPAFEKYRANFETLAGSFDKIYIVVDALDECKEDQREHILAVIINLVKVLPSAKVFVTSRREVNIEDAFKKHETSVIEIEARSVAADIQIFVHDCVSVLVKEDRLKLEDSDLQQSIIRTLVSKAEGMFLWVRLQLDNLCRQRSDRDIKEQLELLPRGLNETYNRIMHQLDRQPDALRSLAKNSLTWVFYAARPLRMGELIEAVAIDDTCKKQDDLKRYKGSVIIEACANLLVQEDDFIRPIHYSAREYFTHPPRNRANQDPSFSLMCSNDAHGNLAKSCLSYLMLGYLQTGPCRNDWDLFQRIRHNKLCWYASQFFDLHIQWGGEQSNDLQAKENKFLIQDSTVLAAVLQLRRIGDGFDMLGVVQDFDPVTWNVNGAAMIYATNLYSFSRFHADHGLLSSLGTPKYTLHQTCGCGLLDGVIRLVASGHSVHDEDYSQATPLYYASTNGHREVCSFLLQNKSDPNHKGGVYGNALQAAAYGGYQAVVKILLEKGANVNAQGGKYGNTLQSAAFKGYELIVKLLLDKGANVNLQGGEYGNALQAAALQGHQLVVKMLLDNGAHVDALGGRYGNALQAAAYGEHDEIVKILLDKGADVNTQGGWYGSALQAAALGRQEAVVKMLLDNGADIKIQGGKYGNALQAAAYGGHETVVKMLLDKGADVNMQGRHYGNALQAASCGGHEAVVKLLLVRGADVNIQGGRYGNALQAAAYGGHEMVVRLLLGERADVNAHGGEYGNSLQAATSRGHTAVVKFLLDKGADLNVQEGMYGNALQAAAYGGHGIVVKMLLAEGADVNKGGGWYGNALQAASCGGHEAVVKLLLVSGADVNIQGGRYGNALQAAAYGGHEAVVKLLLSERADVNAHGGEYGNSLQAATSRGHTAVAKILLDKGARLDTPGIRPKTDRAPAGRAERYAERHSALTMAASAPSPRGERYDALAIPVGKRQGANTANLSIAKFERCCEPWALSSIVTWIKEVTKDEPNLCDDSVVESLVALFTDMVPTMSIGDVKSLGAQILKEMLESGTLVRDKEWVKFGHGSMSGVLWQITGNGCYSPMVHRYDSPGRCYAHHCMRTPKKVKFPPRVVELQRKAEDWATFRTRSQDSTIKRN